MKALREQFISLLKGKTKTDNTPQNRRADMARKVVQKQQSMARRDIGDWKMAVMQHTSTQTPKSYLIQDIYSDISDDLRLSSQINNRKEQSISTPFEMVIDKVVDDNLTEKLREIPIITDILSYIWESEWYGNSLIELSVEKGIHKVTLINRRNVAASAGRFYPDATQNNYIEYRDTKEYGKWILEFNSDHIGLLNKTVPYLLYKKFAISCWSELCEIYGIPPRVMKTETRDPNMLDRAESMMRDIGAASWFIIDSQEEFEFANGVNTNGDVYSNLIKLTNDEVCLFVSGAIIGQDTKHGNESKEESSKDTFDKLVESDKRTIEMYMNSIVIPALIRMNWIPSTTAKFRFSAVEDTKQLWEHTKDLLPHKNVDNKFIEEKFGIPVTDKESFI